MTHGYEFIILLLGIVIFLIVTVLVAQRLYKNFKYELTSQGFVEKSGFLATYFITIPYHAIQHVEIHQTWLSRLVGLVYIYIVTAAITSTTKKKSAAVQGIIPGVSYQEALEIKKELLKRAEH